MFSELFNNICQMLTLKKCCLCNTDFTLVFANNEMSRNIDKTNKVTVRPAETQISLGIHAVWSESLLSAWRKLGPLATHGTHSEDQADLSLCWGDSHFVGFVMSWLKCNIRGQQHYSIIYKDNAMTQSAKTIKKHFSAWILFFHVQYSCIMYSSMYISLTAFVNDFMYTQRQLTCYF